MYLLKRGRKLLFLGLTLVLLLAGVSCLKEPQPRNNPVDPGYEGESLDTNSPGVADGSISPLSLGDGEYEFSWMSADDDITADPDLEYALFYLDTWQNYGDLDSVDEAENDAVRAVDWTNSTSVSVSGLSDGEYLFNVLVRDEAGNKSVYDEEVVSVMAGGGPDVTDAEIKIGTVSSSNIEISWTKVTDTSCYYKVLSSTSDNISTLADAENNGTAESSWVQGMGSFVIDDMMPETSIYVNVIVKDIHGNKSVYDSTNVATMPEGGGADTTAPTLSSLMINNVDAGGFDLKYSINETATVHYALLTTTAGTPSTDDLKNGVPGYSPLDYGNFNSSSGTDLVHSFSVALGSDEYRLYLAAEDGAGNMPNAPIEETVYGPEDISDIYQFKAKGLGWVLTNYSGTDEEVSIPSSYEGSDIIEINGAFAGNATIKKVVIPSTVTNITAAFSHCSSLTNAVLPSSLKAIGSNSFSYCTSLERADIPDSVKTIGNYAFSQTMVGKVMLKSVESIGDEAFLNNTNLGSVEIGSNISIVGYRAFKDCENLKEVTIHSEFAPTYSDESTTFGNTHFEMKIYVNWGSLEEFKIAMSTDAGAIEPIATDWRDFEYTKLPGTSVLTITGYEGTERTIVIPSKVNNSNVVAIEGAFNAASAMSYSIESVYIPDSITNIGNQSFYFCTNLTNVRISQGLSVIGSSAFGDSTALTNITIPYDTKFIGNHAFYGCTALYTVVSEAINPPLLGGGYVFDDNAANRTIIVPFGSQSDYSSATYWDEYSGFIVED